jgi:hypothetical protein
MTADTQPAPTPKWMFWTGWIVSALPALGLVMSGSMKLIQPENMKEGFDHLGWDMNVAFTLGIVELSCTLIYLNPRTSVLGAILLTGYLGGATATHVRIGETAFVFPIILGVLVWGGLYLRYAGVRALVPLRRPESFPTHDALAKDDACGK